MNSSNNNIVYFVVAAILLCLSGFGIYYIGKINAPVADEANIDNNGNNNMDGWLRPTGSNTVGGVIPTGSSTLDDDGKGDDTPVTTMKYSTTDDGFEVSYLSNRKLYQSILGYGNRYTFYRSDSILTVHAGEEWGWQHPGRKFDGITKIDGKDSFVYEIPTQKIVDIKNGNKLYTIQCVHKGLTAAKEECENFIDSFNFL